MNGRGTLRSLIWSAAALTLAVPALGASPGSPQRTNELAVRATSLMCPASDPFLDPPCYKDERLEVRGHLTLIVDKDSLGWDDTGFVPETTFTATSTRPSSAGITIDHTVPTDPSKSTLTVMLEFEHDGRTRLLTESYADLGIWFDPISQFTCEPFCVPTWREPVTEYRIGGAHIDVDSDIRPGGDDGGGGGSLGGARRANTRVMRIRLGSPGEALRQALNTALGLPANALPYFKFTDSVQAFDHSAENDTLATVHRLKVTIRAKVPN